MKDKFTRRLRDEVIFVNTNGCLDYQDPSTQINCLRRLEKTKKVHDYITSLGLRSYRLNPIDGDIPLVPFFPSHPQDDKNFYNNSAFLIYDLLPLLDNFVGGWTHMILYQYDGFPLNFDHWTDDFLDYDYMGPSSGGVGTVMCGGFGIRKHSWMSKVSREVSKKEYVEFARKHGHGNDDMLFHELGFVKDYPPLELRDKFATEEVSPDHFGFHTNQGFDFDHATSLWKHTK